MPVPVITHTFFPSVTGEGEDMFCLRILVLPALRCFFQSTSPFFLSTHHRNRSSPSATLRKMRSFQMIGVAPVQLGMGIFQITFSSVLHRVGRFFSLLTPLRNGPRHCGQLSAAAVCSKASTTVRTSGILLRTLFVLPGMMAVMLDHRP